MTQPTLVVASRATPLITLMYVLAIDKAQGRKGRPTDDTATEISSLAKEVLPIWGKAIPSLKDCLLNILAGKNKDETWMTLGQVMKSLAGQGKGDREVPQEDLELISALGAYFRTDSANAFNKLTKFASLTRNSWVVQKMAPKVGDQQDTKSALEELVKSLVGRKDTALTMEEAVQVKSLKPDSYKAYLGLRKAFNQSWKDALVSFIRKSGKDKVPYNDALEYLKLNGIDHLMPTGFTGMIDDLSRLYTNKGKQIEGVPNAVTFPSVTMNPNYGKPDGGDWVFMANRVDGSPGPYFYTSDFKKGQAKAKFSKVADLSTKIDTMRKKWMTKVKAFNQQDPSCVTAVVLEILYEFAARIGSLGNKAGGQSTYGVATLLVKHAIIDPSGNITLRYKGKDGVSTTHKLLKSDPAARFVIPALHEMLDGKDSKERIFTYVKNGRHVPISPAQVNAFFKACGAPEGTTVHKIRTVTGTKIFKELMDAQFEKPRQPKTEKEAMAIFVKMAEAVGKKLNHVRNGASGTKVTGTTALQAYIDVAIQLEFWLRLNLRVPKYLEKHLESLGND